MYIQGSCIGPSLGQGHVMFIKLCIMLANVIPDLQGSSGLCVHAVISRDHTWLATCKHKFAVCNCTPSRPMQ